MMGNKDLPSQISIKLFNRTRTFGTVAPQATFSTYTGQKHGFDAFHGSMVGLSRSAVLANRMYRTPQSRAAAREKFRERSNHFWQRL